MPRPLVLNSNKLKENKALSYKTILLTNILSSTVSGQNYHHSLSSNSGWKKTWKDTKAHDLCIQMCFATKGVYMATSYIDEFKRSLG